MGKTYRWGIMGAGIIAGKLAEALGLSGEGKLAFVGSRDPERAENFARRYGAEGWGSYEELFDRGDVDVVYVATTHNFHRGNARLALERGKPVLMEKPFTVNAAEAGDLIDLAASKGLFLMEAMWTRFLPATVKLRSLLSEGAIGRIRCLDLSFGNFALPMYEGRLRDPALAGGVTLDMGIYPISFVCHVLGERPSDVRASCIMTDRGVDELASYQFRFPGGALAQIATSFALKMENRAMIYGTEGYVEFPSFPAGDRFILHRHGGTNEVRSAEEVRLEHEANGFVYQVREVHRCLGSGLRESPVMPTAETRELMEVMDRIRAQWGLKYECETGL